jgi:hypothetical protein
MFDPERWQRRLTQPDSIAFGILFILISCGLCKLARVPILVYFPLLFLSGLTAFGASTALLRWFERVAETLEGKRKRYRQRNGTYWDR